MHVLQVFQPESGGVPTYLSALVPGLLACGVRVSVACPPGAGAAAQLRAQGIEILPLEVGRSPHPTRDTMAVRRLVRFCRQRGVSVIHGHSTKAGMLAALSGARAGVPSLYTPHGWAFERHVPAPLRAAHALFERHLVHRYHARVLTVSGSGLDLAERWRVAPPGRVQVVRTGLPPLPVVSRAPARRRLGLGSDEFVAVWVGRAGAQKRPEDLAAIARRLGGRVTVVALCDGARGTRLEADLRDAGVVLPDPPCDPAIVYGAADIMLQTSAWEATPLSILEAMGAGLPVVAYDVGGVGEQVRPGRTGYLVAPGDVEMACECVLALAGQPALRARMRAAGRERASEVFSYPQMVEQLVSAYTEFGSQPGSPRGQLPEPPGQSEQQLSLDAMLFR